MTEVNLAVYDLSQGMARTLSAQFLGPDHVLDLIPHTGIVVFGKEYFFGGGIQAVEPSAFRRMTGMFPIQTHRLGITNISQAQFETWCQQIGQTQFSAQAYDLLNCNCNHFSHTAALQGLQLSQGVPDWILQVPQRFLSSPMGQMIRPVLEQMQITQVAPVQGGTSMGGETPNSLLAAPSTNASHNPWASLDTSATDAKSDPTSKPPSATSTVATDSSSPRSNPESEACILSKFTLPMVSNDTTALTICASKLSPHFSDSNRVALDQVTQSLQRKQPKCDEELVEQTVTELSKLVQRGNGTSSFALLYWRLLALEYYNSESIQLQMKSLTEALRQPSDATEEDTPALHSPAARSLAWCVVSNYTSKTPASISTSCVEAAIVDWNHDSKEVRQAACTFLYNYVIGNGKSLDSDEETMVSLVCSSMEGLVEEMDATTRLRRLLVGARVVFGVHHNSENGQDDGCNEMAKDLVKDLGFCALLQELAGTDYNTGKLKEDQECRQLARELITKLQ